MPRGVIALTQFAYFLARKYDSQRRRNVERTRSARNERRSNDASRRKRSARNERLSNDASNVRARRCVKRERQSEGQREGEPRARARARERATRE
jgi:hypothetical protein